MTDHCPKDTNTVIDLQPDEVLVEIDPDGRVRRVGDVGRSGAGKRTVLHDPKGEYGRGHLR
ncbi:MAG: hypothetical protein QG608_3386 [Actinomycetota bacterium]|nr:hypothetical protein [Actinomycetota bacterium]